MHRYVAVEADDVLHTFERCPLFTARREQAARMLGRTFPPLVELFPVMLSSRDRWDALTAFVTDVMTMKEESERAVQAIIGRR